PPAPPSTSAASAPPPADGVLLGDGQRFTADRAASRRALGGPAWAGVAASRVRPGVLAAWSARHVFESVDGGRPFRRVLDDPSAVRAVAVGDDGALFVARERLGIVDEAGSETWRALPASRTTRLDASGRWLVASVEDDQGRNALAISTDRGKRWSRQEDVPI